MQGLVVEYGRMLRFIVVM